MDIRTYRAATMHEALTWSAPGTAEAAMLHTREVAKRGLFGWLRAAL